MAPLISLLALLVLFTTVLASPHISRNAYNHAHRAVARQPVQLERSNSPVTKRKRSLNKRCIPSPANSTTTSTVLASSAPINVVPVPSVFTSSASPSPPSPSSADAPSSTSTYVAPSPAAEAPSPSPTTSTPPPASPTTSSTPPPAQTSSSSSSGEPSYMTGIQSGQATWYTPGLGACGVTNTVNDYIVAVSESLFDSYVGYNGVNPNTNPVCGRQITIYYQSVSVTVTVRDRCTGCSETSLDLSPVAFDVLAAASVGRIDITWEWTG